MKLYILRHGHAPGLSEAKVASDAERPLSEVGRADVRSAVQEILRRGGRPSLILHSPLRRAADTAREAAAILKPAEGTEMFPPLANELPGPLLWDRLRERCAKTSEVLAIGHQPQLGELAACLAGTSFAIKTAGLVALELEPGPNGSTMALWSRNPEER